MLTYVSVLHRYRALLQSRVGVKLRCQNNLLTDFFRLSESKDFEVTNNLLTDFLALWGYDCFGEKLCLQRLKTEHVVVA